MKYHLNVQFENVAATEVFLEGYNQYVEYGVGYSFLMQKKFTFKN